MSSHLEVEQHWEPDDIWDEIVAVFDSSEVQEAMAARDEFAAKYLVRGQLLVTAKQFEVLSRIRTAQEFEDLHHQQTWLQLVGGSPRPPRLTDVPVRVIGELPVDLGGGLKAIYGNGTIYVYREVDFNEKVGFNLPQGNIAPDLKGLPNT